MPSKHKHGNAKACALREEGTLNAAPEKVADPKFRASEFFDPRDAVQVKYEMLRRVLVESASVTEATQQYGVSRPTYYQTRERFDKAGIAGLVAKKRGPQGSRKIQGDVLALIQERVVAGQPLRARELAEEIRRRFGIDVHARTIERAIQKKTAR